MAARTGAMQMGRLGSGMSGQAAMAGIQERSEAQKALSDMMMKQQALHMQGALQSRQNAIGAYGGGQVEKSWGEKWGPAIGQGISAMAGKPGAGTASDRRLKTDIEDGDTKANKILDGLKSYTFKYKDSKYGKGEQLGIMAQDLERLGLKQAVTETAAGKALDAGKLSGANTAMIAALSRRLMKLEGDDSEPKASRRLNAEQVRRGLEQRLAQR